MLCLWYNSSVLLDHISTLTDIKIRIIRGCFESSVKPLSAPNLAVFLTVFRPIRVRETPTINQPSEKEFLVGKSWLDSLVAKPATSVSLMSGQGEIPLKNGQGEILANLHGESKKGVQKVYLFLQYFLNIQINEQ